MSKKCRHVSFRLTGGGTANVLGSSIIFAVLLLNDRTEPIARIALGIAAWIWLIFGAVAFIRLWIDRRGSRKI